MIRALLLLAHSQPEPTQLFKMLSGQREIEVVGIARNTRAARKLLTTTSYDTVFLDSRLPSRDGFELLPLAPHSARIVLLTLANRSTDRIRTPGKFVNSVACPSTSDEFTQLLDLLLVRDRARGPLIPIRDGKRIRLLELENIRIIAARENYTEVHLLDGERFLLRRTMKDWDRSLPALQFVRAHRSVLVNLAAIERIDRYAGQPFRLSLERHEKPVELHPRLWTSLKKKLNRWQRSNPARAQSSRLSVVVLPFEDLSEIRTEPPPANGICDELTTILSTYPELRVAGITTASNSKRQDFSVTELRQKLKANVAIEGSVRHTGPNLRVNVRLIHTSTGFAEWSSTYERAATDSLALADKMARQIAATLTDPKSSWRR